MKLDLLVIAAHPDDAEVAVGGTLIKHIKEGRKAGIIDLTCGELGTRGNADIRLTESEEASRVLGLHHRSNLNLKDCFFQITEENIIKVIQVIRKFRPEIVIANPPADRHPDHGRASDLVKEAVFMSPMSGIRTTDTMGNNQQPWKVKKLFYYIQDAWLEPDIYLDITPFYLQKEEAFRTYRSQFYNPVSTEPETPISTPAYFGQVKTRNGEWGRRIGVEFAEGLLTDRPPGLKSLFDIF